jgi:membrane protein DedA with SNARE-associated domain
MGLPLPGETVLVIAALYGLSIWGVVAAAATGAILGDNVGYWLGREFGYRLVLSYGRYIGLSAARIKLGQYLFQRHGGKVVFFGRFIAVLRILAAFLAGMNCMGWRRFLLANAAGGLLCAGLFGFAAYTFGKVLLQITGPAAVALGIIGFAAFVGLTLYLRAHEAELEAEAERALPGTIYELGACHLTLRAHHEPGPLRRSGLGCGCYSDRERPRWRSLNRPKRSCPPPNPASRRRRKQHKLRPSSQPEIAWFIRTSAREKF